jgi:hypothetical protein
VARWTGSLTVDTAITTRRGEQRTRATREDKVERREGEAREPTPAKPLQPQRFFFLRSYQIRAPRKIATGLDMWRVLTTI